MKCLLVLCFIYRLWRFLLTCFSLGVWTDLGLRQPRLEGEEYLSIIDEFIEAVLTRWPKAIVQVSLFQK